MKSWRDVYKIHPEAEKWPLMSEDKLREMGEDIGANGQREPIALWSLSPEDSESAVVLDGRNRLDAMELVGMETLRLIGDKYRLKVPVVYLSLEKNLYAPSAGGINPYSYTRSKNRYRRHLTKEQYADSIVQEVKLEQELISPSLARSFSPTPDQRGGSTKDFFKQEVIERAAPAGISQRTIERSLAKANGPVQTPRARSNGKDETIPYSPNISNYAIDRIAQKCIQLLVHEFRNLKQSDVEQVLTAIAEHFAPNAVEEIF